MSWATLSDEHEADGIFVSQYKKKNIQEFFGVFSKPENKYSAITPSSFHQVTSMSADEKKTKKAERPTNKYQLKTAAVKAA